MSKFWFVVFIISGLPFLLADPTEAVPKLQVRLIRASNEAAELSDPKVNSLNAQLKSDFGYSNYQQIFFSESQYIFDEKAIYQMPDDFGITITYKGKRKGKREFFVETAYRGKKFVGFYASFPDNAKPVLIRGPGTDNGRYIIALTVGS
jgi:hypothetical protein